MSLLKGNASIVRFQSGQVPASSNSFWLEKLNENKFVGPASEDGVYGWAVAGNELETTFTPTNAVQGKFVIFSLRVDTIKVPKSLFNLAVEKALHNELEATESETISRKRKTEIKEDIKETLIQEAQPTIQTVQLAVDTHSGHVYAAGTSTKLLDYLVVLFSKTFDKNLRECTYINMLADLKGEAETNRLLENMSRIDLNEGGDLSAGWDLDLGFSFISWLSYLTDTDGTYKYKAREYGAMIAEQVGLESVDEVGNSNKTVLKKGSVVNYPEFKSAIASGKLISMAKIEMALEEESWVFTLDARKSGIKGIKAPRFTDGLLSERTIYRLNSLCEVFEVVDQLFSDYVENVYGDQSNEVITAMQLWAR